MFATLGKLLQSFLPQPISQEQAAMAASRIESVISKAGTIAVFSKSYCPYIILTSFHISTSTNNSDCVRYCTRAKGILSGYKGVKPRMQIIELDHEKEGTAIQEALATKLGKSRVTVPQVRLPVIWISQI